MEVEMLLSTRVYRLTPLTKGIMALLFLVFLGMDWLFLFVSSTVTNAIQNQDPRDIFYSLCGIGISLLVLYVFVRNWNIRLEISSEGITFFCPPSYTIYTPWQNVMSIKSRKGREIRKGPFGTKRSIIVLSGEALVLREPARRDLPLSEGKPQGIAVIERASFLASNNALSKQSPEISFAPWQFFRNKEEKEEFYAYVRTMADITV